jgi:hypothetical protein
MTLRLSSIRLQDTGPEQESVSGKVKLPTDLLHSVVRHSVGRTKTEQLRLKRPTDRHRLRQSALHHFRLSTPSSRECADVSQLSFTLEKVPFLLTRQL